MFRSGVLPVLTVGLVGHLAAVPAMAQNNTSSSQPSKPAPAKAPAKAPPRKPAAKNEQEKFFQEFYKPMTLPDVPEMGGTKYRFGLQHYDKKTMLMSVGQRYGTTSSPKDVVDFFKTSLMSMKWKLKTSSLTGVEAVKADKLLVVKIVPKSSKDVNTDFLVDYSYKSDN
jgi:hypothetical protein